MRYATLVSIAVGLLLAPLPAEQQVPFRTLNDTFEPPRFTDAGAWKRRAEYLREHILASAGLLPMPERTPLTPRIFGEIKRNGYTVSKVYFESLPGLFVTGNLYRPLGEGPFPAILAPHGHWQYGRLENTSLNSVPGRAINLARQGYVVLTHDMIGYGDSRQLPHTFGGRREYLWGLSLGGLQLWNAIRALDFLESLPYVRRDAIGVTGESGGGTQTFLLAAVDDRVAVAAPVNMISLHMQGGCLCENLPGLRLETTNVEIAATIAPRPLLMIAATGDWTKNTLEREYPAVRAIYSLFGASDRVHAARFDAEHNYNRESREAMYAWMARWLQEAPAEVHREERSFTAEAPADLLVFYQRPMPAHAVTPAELTYNWIEAAQRQIASAGSEVLNRSLRHALGFGEAPRVSPAPSTSVNRNVVFVADAGSEVERHLRQAGFELRAVPASPFDTAAAEKVRHFETYNRTTASQRVADLVNALRSTPGAAVVAAGDAALPALMAAAIAPPRLLIADVSEFDPSSDADFERRRYIPGIRRAGDLQTAAAAYTGTLIVHNAGSRFTLRGTEPKAARMSPAEITAALRGVNRPRR